MAMDTTKNAKVNIEVDSSMEVTDGTVQLKLSARDGNLLYFKENGMLSLRKITPDTETDHNISIHIDTSVRGKKNGTASIYTKKYIVWAPDGSGDQLQSDENGVIYRVKADGTTYYANESDTAYANAHNTWANPANYNTITRKNMSDNWGGSYVRSTEVNGVYNG